MAQNPSYRKRREQYLASQGRTVVSADEAAPAAPKGKGKAKDNNGASTSKGKEPADRLDKIEIVVTNIQRTLADALEAMGRTMYL